MTGPGAETYCRDEFTLHMEQMHVLWVAMDSYSNLLPFVVKSLVICPGMWWNWETDQLSEAADLMPRKHGFLLNTETELARI